MSTQRIQRKRRYALYRIRSELINRVLDVFAIVAPFAALASLARASSLGFLPVMGLHLAIAVVLAIAALSKNRLAFRIRLLIVLAVLQLVGFSGTYNFGLSGNGVLFYLASVVIGGVTLGYRWALLLLLISIAQLSAFTATVFFGAQTSQIDFTVYNLSPGSWAATLMSFVALASGAVFIQQRFNAFLMELIEDQERQIAKRTEQLSRANQTKSDFLSTMSHEIRTPLATTLGMLDSLQKTNLNPEQQHKVAAARNSALSLLSMVSDIMDFARIEAGSIRIEPSRFNVVQMVGAIMESYAAAADEKRICLVLDSPTELTNLNHQTIEADAKRLGQVFNNLIDNAIKFTDSGRVMVRVWLEKDSGNCNLHCSVEDTGIGINASQLAQLSEAFTQQDSGMSRRHSGVGLGLAICKNLIRMMGGQLQVQSSPGKGSCFRFQIPIGVATVPTEGQIPLSCDARLVIADTDYARLEALQRLFLPQMVAADTYQLTEPGADNVAKFCQDLSGQFDIILFDTSQLADYTRRSTQKEEYRLAIADLKARRLSRRGLLVALSSNNDRATQLVLRESGFDALVVQPVTPADVNALVTLHAPQSQPSEHETEPLVEDETILLVEDHAINAEVVAALLRELGFTVKWVVNGREALDWLQDKTDIALVLMDCQMPELDGFECTRQIRAGEAGQSLCQLPIVALTAHAHGEDRQDCLDAGMNDYLSKPVQPKLLIESIVGHGWLEETNRKRLLEYVQQLETQSQTSSFLKLGEIGVAVDGEDEATGSLFDILPEEIPVWDITSVRARVLQKEQLLQGLVKTFCSDSQQQLKQLLAVCRDKDLVGIGRVAHGLKGSASNLGAVRVHFLAARVEAEARQNGRVPGAELIGQLQQEMTRLIGVLNEYLTSAQSSVKTEAGSVSIRATNSEFDLFLDSLCLRLEEHDYIDPAELTAWQDEFSARNLQSSYTDLLAQIEKFDLDAAHKTCRFIQSRLNSSSLSDS